MEIEREGTYFFVPRLVVLQKYLFPHLTFRTDLCTSLLLDTGGSLQPTQRADKTPPLSKPHTSLREALCGLSTS
jgi:hypothetical protein